MVNTEKILLLTMISLLLPGALPDAFAEGQKSTKSPTNKRGQIPRSMVKSMKIKRKISI